MELKEGMYVRYTRGAINGYVPPRIAKIIDINSDLLKLDNNNEIFENDVIKTRNKITDLIEQDDLLEIRYLIKSNEYQKEIVQVIKNYAGKLYVNTFPKKIFVEDFDRYGIEILSIVTKEQFNSVKYEVKRS